MTYRVEENCITIGHNFFEQNAKNLLIRNKNKFDFGRKILMQNKNAAFFIKWKNLMLSLNKESDST